VLEWLIIGGGIQGTYLSHLFTNHLGISRKHLRVLDPYGEPLAVWRHPTANCGISHLRSPATHNIDLGIMSLHRFIRSRGGPQRATLSSPIIDPVSSYLTPTAEP
jgi:hypothetical protein